VSVFPQLTSGAIVQFPFRSTYRRRTIVNELADGRFVRFHDWGVSTTAWRIEYSDLGEAEWEAIRNLHEEAEGRLRTFLFFDPNGNLMAWTEDFEREIWVKDPFLAVGAAVADPLGGLKARRLTNSSSAEQQMTQLIPVPQSYETAFSVWLRSDSPAEIYLVRGGDRKEVRVDTRWRRVALCGRGSGDGSSNNFGLLLSGGASVDAFGAQVEVQSAPSDYKRNESSAGVYPFTRFTTDRLECWSDGPGRFRAVVNLESVVGVG
jgi:hypothetical protein